MTLASLSRGSWIRLTRLAKSLGLRDQKAEPRVCLAAGKMVVKKPTNLRSSDLMESSAIPISFCLIPQGGFGYANTRRCAHDWPNLGSGQSLDRARILLILPHGVRRSEPRIHIAPQQKPTCYSISSPVSKSRALTCHPSATPTRLVVAQRHGPPHEPRPEFQKPHPRLPP